MGQRRITRALGKPLGRKLDKPRSQGAWLGNAAGTVVAGGNQVYITLLSGQVTTAFNNRVAPIAGQAVWVGRSVEQPSLFQVLSTRTGTPLGVGGGAGFNYAPATNYQWMWPGGGQDPIMVALRQYLPLRVGTWDGMTVLIWDGIVWADTQYAEVTKQTLDLTSHIPATAGKAAFVLITVSTAAAIVATKGSEVNIADLGADDVPAVPANTARVLAAVRVYTGQTAVQEAGNETDVVDLRGAGWDYFGDTDNSAGSIEYSAGNISNPPTYADLLAVLGDPAAFGTGKIAHINDNAAGANEYLVVSDGSRYWLHTLTRAYLGMGTTASATNASGALAIDTYDGSDQPVHPCVLDLGVSGWNGWRYWMVMTPYPNEDDSKENPSILVSADGTTWAAPDGLTNPAVAAPASGYNSDPCILLGQDNKLWMFHRWAAQYNVSEKMYILSSSDGVTWSAAAELLTGTGLQLISPFVLWDGTQYVMWCVDASSYPSAGFKLMRRTCATPGGTWSAAAECTLTNAPSGKDIWHVTVTKRVSRYDIFATFGDGGTTSSNDRLFLGTSTDGETFTFASTPLLDKSVSGWDNGLIHYGRGLITASGYDLFYSAFNAAMVGKIGRTTVTLS